MSKPTSEAELRDLVKLVNARTRYISDAFSKGGLATIAGGAGLIWNDASAGAGWLVAFMGFTSILVGLGLLDFLRPEE